MDDSSGFRGKVHRLVLEAGLLDHSADGRGTCPESPTKGTQHGHHDHIPTPVKPGERGARRRNDASSDVFPGPRPASRSEAIGFFENDLPESDFRERGPQAIKGGNLLVATERPFDELELFHRILNENCIFVQDPAAAFWGQFFCLGRFHDYTRNKGET